MKRYAAIAVTTKYSRSLMTRLTHCLRASTTTPSTGAVCTPELNAGTRAKRVKIGKEENHEANRIIPILRIQQEPAHGCLPERHPRSGADRVLLYPAGTVGAGDRLAGDGDMGLMAIKLHKNNSEQELDEFINNYVSCRTCLFFQPLIFEND